MGKSVKETKKEIRGRVKTNAKGNLIPSFSREEFNRLLNATLNDSEYEAEIVAVSGGELETKKIPVTKQFREKFIKPILIDAGVPKEDAEKIATSYEFRNAQTEGLYDLIADAVYNFMDCGKKFNFHNHSDFTGSIFMKDVEECKVERDIRDMKTKEVTGRKKEKREKHRTLAKKSTCPKWLRHAMA